jgi:hypothetical protein
MTRRIALIRIAATVALIATAVSPTIAINGARERVTDDTRHEVIRHAQVWMPTNVAAMDLRRGLQDRRGIEPDSTVTCTYAPRHFDHGHSPKFDCTLADGEVVKVKYGQRNPEVYGEVLATRLLWALGFGADAWYPVRVVCRGCSSDPWNKAEPVNGTQTFDPAAIEKPMKHLVETHNRSGWTWSELDLVDASVGGAPVAQRDALKLLAVFLQHTDTKAAQQRLVCLDHGWKAGEPCGRPLMYLHDVGFTFGTASLMNHPHTASVNLAKWSITPIWKDQDRCVGNLEKAFGGTIGNPRISEAGRAFLAARLSQLTDRQLDDLFAASRIERYSPRETIGDWVAVFKAKRADIVNHRCPS